MAPVIWGLDLSEIKWSKFKSSYMWSGDYHLRRTKFIVYQGALIFCVVSESLGTAVLSDYVSGQARVRSSSGYKVNVFNDDYVGAASYNIFAGVFVATIFGAAFFFDLFWPERTESKGVRISWKVCGVLAVIFALAAALTLTIITATHRAYVRGDIAPYGEDYWWTKYPKSSEVPLVYRSGGRAIAAVVFVWLGWCCVVPSCVLLFLSINHAEKGQGMKSRHARERDLGSNTTDSELEKKLPEQPPELPPSAYTSPVEAGYLRDVGRASNAAAAERNLQS